MTKTEKLLEKLREMEKTLNSSDAMAISDAIVLVENAVPAIDLLQDRLERREYLAQQDGQWHLFDSGGEGVTSGKTLRDILLNLIWIDC